MKAHQATGSTYRGAPTDMCIGLAFAQTGSLQIELVQQLNDAPSLFTEFRGAGREGLHHVAFWTVDFDNDLARYISAGYSVVQSAGLSGPNNRNAFIEKADAGNAELAIEISEIRGSKGEFFKTIAAASGNWDGRDPVRPVV